MKLLLSKSNFKQTKGTSIGILALLIIITFLINLSFLLIFDVYKNTDRQAKKLNAGDGTFAIINMSCDVPLSYADSLFENNNNVKEYECYETLYYQNLSLTYGNGRVSPGLFVDKESHAYDTTINKTEIVVEDKSITSNYIYLPYIMNKGGKVDLGSDYTINFANKSITYKVKGFINNVNFGSHNNGFFLFVVSDSEYDNLKANTNSFTTEIVNFILKDNSNVDKFVNKLSNDILADYPFSFATGVITSSAMLNRGFMALILGVSFISLTIILVLVIMLMLSNSISNYIKENMKSLGALKAIGYTSFDLRLGLLLLFIILAAVGSILGLALSYISMPLIGSVSASNQGFPYSVRLHPLLGLISILITFTITILLVLLFTRKIRRIEPIIALKDGMENHSFKKNYINLESSKCGLNLSLSLKTMFNNLKQNIITFFVTGLICFVGTLALLMFYNFGTNPKISLLTFEECSGVVAVKYENKEEVKNYIINDTDALNIRMIINLEFKDNDYGKLQTYIVDDASKLNNKDCVYKGRFPKYDNEVVVSGKYAKLNGYAIGDEIDIYYGSNSYTYLITGLMQTCNNGGSEAILTTDATSHILDLTTLPAYYWFDLEDSTKESTKAYLDNIKDKFGDSITTTLNFDEIIEGGIQSFVSLSTLMLISMSLISVVIIILVLYLLIKTLVFSKRKEYGVLKALGYKSKDLIIQTSISFMPSIILSTIIFSILSYLFANTYMSFIMILFGVMKCSFYIPISWMILMGILIILVSFIMSVLMARRIKNIEPYKLLIGE